MVRLKIPMLPKKNANWKLRKLLEWETRTLPEDKGGSGTTSLYCWEYKILGFQNGFGKKAVTVGKLRNKNKMQRRGLSVNFNFLGFGEGEGGFSCF